MSAVRRWARRLGLAVAGALVTAVLLGVAAHASPTFGAALADAVREVAGPAVVAWAEDVTYDVEDRIKGLVYADAAPKQFWDQPDASAPPPAPGFVSVTADASVRAAFLPKAFDPPVAKVAGRTDGQWLAVADPDGPGDPLFFKTLVHPDAKRSYAAVAVVAIDLARLNLSLAAGTVEPVSPVVSREQRPGLVPADALADLVAAFNGGFKAEHGHYGMMVDGVVLLPPRERACTIAITDEGAVHIAGALDPELARSVRSSRQTPPCLVEDGELDDRLVAADDSKRWGAAVGGATVIRRSALGVSADGKTLFYGLGDSVTAGALARAMKAAGADDAAQLDVNAAYPRFLFYAHPKDEPPAVDSPLIPDLKFGPHEYVREPEPRDFFFLTRKRPGAT